MTTIESEDNIYHEHFPNIALIIDNKAKKICRTTTALNFLPIFNWLPKYKPSFLIQDCVAGFTVGLTAIPQAIAYGIVAGLPAQYGLYSAFMGCFVYIFFGSCPTAIMALMVQQLNVSVSPDFAVLACFLSGCVITALGLLNLGVLVQFISVPVTIGFTMAAAITIGSGQINNLFGIASSSNEFLESWKTLFAKINSSMRLNDTLLGVFTIILLLAMKRVQSISCNYPDVMKYITLSRNAVAVILGALVAYMLNNDGSKPFRLSGEITPGLPPFQLPPFSTKINETEYSLWDMSSNLGPSIITIPLVAILESIAISKAFSKGKIIDASQEMISLGICNILGSFVSSMPVTGSFTRTAINHSSGVRTPLGGAVTGAIVLMALAFLTKAFYYIPKATLAAIIIAAMISMIEYETVIEIWRSKKMDILPFMVTILTCLFWGLEYGMICGISVNMVFILYGSARPRIAIATEKFAGNKVGIVELPSKLEYSAAEYLKAKVVKFVSTQNNELSLIILKGEELYSIDSTVAMNIISLQEDLNILNCKMICWNWNYNVAGVVCRFNTNARDLFKFDKTLQETLSLHFHNKTENS